MVNDYKDLITAIHQELGISDSYKKDHKLNLQEECSNLVAAGEDIFNREVKMEIATKALWDQMYLAAFQVGIELQLVSAFRSVDYQKNLILKKLAAGISIEQILQVNAAPGYSEHHTGRALDLTCPGSECLEESFEHTSAFAWLEANAANFGFKMSFPRENVHGLLYEPWHWCQN